MTFARGLFIAVASFAFVTEAARRYPPLWV
jgi:hypothetical protein